VQLDETQSHWIPLDLYIISWIYQIYLQQSKNQGWES